MRFISCDPIDDGGRGILMIPRPPLFFTRLVLLIAPAENGRKRRSGGRRVPQTDAPARGSAAAQTFPTIRQDGSGDWKGSECRKPMHQRMGSRRRIGFHMPRWQETAIRQPEGVANRCTSVPPPAVQTFTTIVAHFEGGEDIKDEKSLPRKTPKSKGKPPAGGHMDGKSTR